MRLFGPTLCIILKTQRKLFCSRKNIIHISSGSIPVINVSEKAEKNGNMSRPKKQLLTATDDICNSPTNRFLFSSRICSEYITWVDGGMVFTNNTILECKLYDCKFSRKISFVRCFNKIIARNKKKFLSCQS